jgi:hypothetical protein
MTRFKDPCERHIACLSDNSSLIRVIGIDVRIASSAELFIAFPLRSKAELLSAIPGTSIIPITIHHSYLNAIVEQILDTLQPRNPYWVASLVQKDVIRQYRISRVIHRNAERFLHPMLVEISIKIRWRLRIRFQVRHVEVASVAQRIIRTHDVRVAVGKGVEAEFVDGFVLVEVVWVVEVA